MQAVVAPLDVVRPLPAAPHVNAADKAKMLAKSREFEAYYVQQFVSLTRPDLSENDLFGGGFAESTFTQFMDEQIGQAVAKRGSFGVADRVYAELLKTQEAANAAIVPAPIPTPSEGE